MRRVVQQRLVEVNERGVRKPDSSGDCFPACIASIFEVPLADAPGENGNTQALLDWCALNFPGITVVSRSWPYDPERRCWNPGYWIATVLSPRFREAECHHCTENLERVNPPYYVARADCRRCDGTGEAIGLHAIVMEFGNRVWDPHPKADWDSEPKIVGEHIFVVADPARLVPRVVPTPIARAAA